MGVSEIYKSVSAHLIKALMTHDELAKIYSFLCLDGYSKLHEHYYHDESRSYREINKYYEEHHGKLIPEEDVNYKSIIPDSWYNYTRKDVDEGTKKSAVRTYMNKWVDWEKESKALYERAYNELCSIGEVASACKIKELVCDVDAELKKAERYLITCETLGYDIGWIIEEQHRIKKKYEHK